MTPVRAVDGRRRRAARWSSRRTPARAPGRSSSGCARSRAPGRGPAAPTPPLVVEAALGSTIVDPDGNRFVDLAASFAAATVGHGHPAVVAAIRDQAGRAGHVSSASISEARVAFEEALVGIAPAGSRSGPARPDRLGRQ